VGLRRCNLNPGATPFAISPAIEMPGGGRAKDSRLYCFDVAVIDPNSPTVRPDVRGLDQLPTMLVASRAVPACMRAATRN
jgi:hypothetical protein